MTVIVITHLKKLRDDVCDILGQEEIKCPHCGHVEHQKHKIPENIWRYLIIKNCDTSKEEKRLMLHWHHEYADSKKLQELLLKLDATHDIDVPSLAHGPEYEQSVYIEWELRRAQPGRVTEPYDP